MVTHWVYTSLYEIKAHGQIQQQTYMKGSLGPRNEGIFE